MTDQRKLVVDMLSKAFLDNPRVLRTVKKGNTEKKLRIMTEYAYDLVYKHNGVFLSSDNSTAMLYYIKSKHKKNLLDTWRYIRMFLLCIKPTKAPSIQKREEYLESLRPQGIDYIYVWLLGNNPEIKGLKGLAEIRNHLDEQSIKNNLPILIETTVERNLKLYQYVGFEIYHHWYDPKEDLNVWFLMREIKVARKNFEKAGRTI
ncbi:MAG: hypothetical protein H6540_00035 [Bacteroidales bacterium]|nr:hypothetical protein [Bacteroidales bacterium]MCB9012887.1 hypothetical protein [Bacteroidales bacterium]